MAATGIGNPAGFQEVSNWDPRTFQGTAKENISGGVFVFASGADNVVSSGANSFVTSDVQLAMDASGAQFNGVALQYAASGAAVTFATQGLFLLVANGTVTAGYPVQCDGNNSVANTGSATIAAGTFGKSIGRALTSAASGGYALVQIGL